MNDNQSLHNSSAERAALRFREEASRTFDFLKEIGFAEVGASPTTVQYEWNGLSVNVYHGRQSYEVEFEIVRDGKRYSLSELIRLVAPEEGEAYRNSVATTVTTVVAGLHLLRSLVRRYAMEPLRGDPVTFVALDRQRKEWARSLALKTQVASIKPKAEESFRLGRYAQAAELYDQIRLGLSPAELRRADLARKRAEKAK